MRPARPGGRDFRAATPGCRVAQPGNQREAEAGDLISNLDRRSRRHGPRERGARTGKESGGHDRVTAIGGRCGGQHERRQQVPGTVLSATQRLQGIFESPVRGREQGRKVPGPLHGGGGRRQVRTVRNASLEGRANLRQA